MLKKWNLALLLILFDSLIPSVVAQRVETQESGNAAIYFNEGLESYQQGKYKEAVDSLRKAIRLSGGFAAAARKPEWREAVVKLGIAQNLLGDHDSAWNTFTVVILNQQSDKAKQIIPLDIENAQAYYDLGRAYYVTRGMPGLGNFNLEAAIELFKRAISLKPDYAEVYEHLGNSYNAQHKYELSTESYQQAIRLKPEEWWSYNGIGDNYAALRHYNEAIKFYQKAMDLYRKSFGEEQLAIIKSLAIVYLDSGDRKRATEQYNILKKGCLKRACGGMVDELGFLIRKNSSRSARR
jgi:tetratricopeptide (TPR) repeat protein